MTTFDLAAALRRIRRCADLSQRELATALGIAASTVAHAEVRRRDLPVRLLATAAEVAGLRLALLDAEGAEVTSMEDSAVRDERGRRFPAHLDPRHGDEGWWHGPERYSRNPPTYTFDRNRRLRDGRRHRTGVPTEHLRPQQGDSLAERAAARQREVRRREEAERRAWLETHDAPGLDWGSGCTCPSACEYDEECNEDLGHAPACRCRCDVA
jgi:transcriptional regulator with XRE-family HTH domain